MSHSIVQIAKHWKRSSRKSFNTLPLPFSKQYFIAIPQLDEAWSRKILVRKLSEYISDLKDIRYDETSPIRSLFVPRHHLL